MWETVKQVNMAGEKEERERGLEEVKTGFMGLKT